MENSVKVKKFNFTWFIPKSKKLKLMNYLNETPKEELSTKVKALSERWFKFEVDGLEKIPEEGKAVIVMNHRSLFDPVVLTYMDREVIFIAGSKLWSDPVFRPILEKYECIKLDIESPSIDFYREVRRRLNDQEIVGIYPEGTRNGLRKKRPIYDGAGRFAANSEAPVIPIYIYYKRKYLGLLIPHVTKIKAVVGDPFMVEKKDIKGSGEIAMSHILALKDEAKQMVKRK